MPDTTSWVIRDVPEETRHKIKVYAAQHRLTIAEALEKMIDSELALERMKVKQTFITLQGDESREDLIRRITELVVAQMAGEESSTE